MQTKKDDKYELIRKRYRKAQEDGTLTNGWTRKAAYSEQDVAELSTEIKGLWSKIISALSNASLMHGKTSEDLLLLGLAINKEHICDVCKCGEKDGKD